MRTLLALLTAVSMLHLTLAGGRVACAAHSALPASGMRAMSGSDMHAMSRSGAEPVTDCASGAQSDCCDAMSSCGVTMAVAIIEHVPALETLAAATPALASTLRDGVPVAPEPPPPKA